MTDDAREAEGDEQWPHQRDDPGAVDEYDPADEVEPDVPTVEVPEPPSVDDADAPPELRQRFWKLVLIFNAALFAMALGPMLVFFRGNVVDGGAVFLVGLAAFAYGYVQYRRASKAFSEGELTDHNG